MNTFLKSYGWSAFYETSFEKVTDAMARPARITIPHRTSYSVQSEYGELIASLSGRLRHELKYPADHPAVGDWVAIVARPDEGRATIHAVLDRRSAFSRKVAGEKIVEQIVASNLDSVFLVSGLDGDYNVPRIERYLAVAGDSGAAPVIVLNKSDLLDRASLAVRIREVERATRNAAPVLAMSAEKGDGIEKLIDHLGPGKTGAFVGSSGVGKSTIINCLLGEEIQTTDIVQKGSDRGKHTTTKRELILLGERGIVIDTPGLREVQLWIDEESVGEAFAEIDALISGCRFTDCRHETEPGCAVLEAIENGTIDRRRYESYLKLRSEATRLATQKNDLARMEERRRNRRTSRMHREAIKRKKR